MTFHCLVFSPLLGIPVKTQTWTESGMPKVLRMDTYQ